MQTLRGVLFKQKDVLFCKETTNCIETSKLLLFTCLSQRSLEPEHTVFYQNKCIKACCVYLSLSLALSLSPCFYLVPLGWEAAVGSGRTCALTWSQNFNEMYECCIIGHQLFPPVIRLTNIETDCQGSFATMSENIMGFTLSPCDSHILIFLFLLKVIFPFFNSTDWQKNNNDNK